VRAQDVVASGSISLVGPFDATHAAGTAVKDAGRLQPVTIDALKGAGFEHFAWVYKAEKPGGHSLGPDHEQGAFVYEHRDGDFFFFQLAFEGTLRQGSHATGPHHHTLDRTPPSHATGPHHHNPWDPTVTR
jgi:hypothetical protein